MDNKLNMLMEHRVSSFKSFLRGRLGRFELTNRNLSFFSQNRMRHIKKAHDQESIIFNYFYHLSKIERIIQGEREMAKKYPELTKPTKIKEMLDVHYKRINQMIKRLFIEHEVEVIDSYYIYNDIIEFQLKSNLVKDELIIIHTHRENLPKMKKYINKRKKSVIEWYLPFIIYDLDESFGLTMFDM